MHPFWQRLPDSGISRIAAWSIVAVFTFGLVYPRGDSLLPAPAWKHFDKVQHAGGYALCVAALAIAHMTWFGLTSAPPFRFLPGHAIGPSQPGSAHRRAGPWSEPDASSSESGHKWGLRYPRLRKLAMAAMAHALTTELVQALTPRRSASAEDLVADMAGVSLGLCAVLLFSSAYVDAVEARGQGDAKKDG